MTQNQGTEASTESMLDPIEQAVDDIAAGKFVVVVDDEDRENEGDLIIAADAMTEEKMAFMIRHTSGVICAPMLDERAESLRLPLMVADNTETHRTAFTVTVDLIEGCTTGISAGDRARTLQALANPGTAAGELSRPGHIFPLRGRPGGVLKRAGHTEATIDLCRLAGRTEVGAICEIVNDDGTMKRLTHCREFASEHGLTLISIADLIRHRRHSEQLVDHFAEATIPTKYGVFTAHAYRSLLDDEEHLVYAMGDLDACDAPLVRVHSECLTGDILASDRCDCGSQLQLALQMIAEEECGVLVYLRGHEGRGIGIGHKIRAYALQDNDELDTVDANTAQGLPVDSREYGVGANILADLGLTRMRLMTNNPAKYGGLEGYGLEIVERVPIEISETPANSRYLTTKRDRLGHIMTNDSAAGS
jgi:3,4-dihydroxy 2-butanone 4-phosphate synthase/GTP cyclohydrolase II